MNYKKYIREKKSKNRCDLTLLFGNYSALNTLFEEMAKPFISVKVDKIVAIEATGFIFGAGVAKELEVGLCLIRKPNKLAWDVNRVEFTDYTKKKKGLEIAKDAILPNEKVVIVDDWSETGAQLKAAIYLVEQLGGNVVGISCAQIDERVKRDATLLKYKLNSVMNC